MPDYRRFIAYFYEYIDGKKQKNAGFAKVELRNGMWRLLFRLTMPTPPEAPLRVYGFVRAGEYLLGVPMGMLRTGREVAEEWAYRAETPVGESGYRLEDFAGIRVESEDGRCFLTVWDDEPVQPERFVLELPEAVQNVAVKTDEQQGAAVEPGDGPSQSERFAAELPEAVQSVGVETDERQGVAVESGDGLEESERFAAGVLDAEPETAAYAVNTKMEAMSGVRNAELDAASGVLNAELEAGSDGATAEIEAGLDGATAEAEAGSDAEYAEMDAVSGVLNAEREAEPDAAAAELEAGPDEATAEMGAPSGEANAEPETAGKRTIAPARSADSEIEMGAEVSNAETAKEEQHERRQSGASWPEQERIERLFEMRSHFQPFSDAEITNCVMILPCDIVRLQQDGWQVGRSSFLQHGFYQHRHLLFGKAADGAYVIGVPGMQNAQEQYMAGMFGFDRFKPSKRYGCGKVFGYWWRPLHKIEEE